MDLKLNNGDPGGILTHDLQNRNLTLYTAELRGRYFGLQKYTIFSKLQAEIYRGEFS
jgi:hypothetical protein